MTTTTVSSAVAKRDSGPAELVRQSRDWFRTIVPSHVDANAFAALTIGYLRKNSRLAEAAERNPQSFMAALSECARLGLVPGDTFHLVPFENSKNGTTDITGITDYTGEIELIYRAGAVASVKAEIVYRNDHFRYTTDMDRPEHAPDWFGDRGDLIGAYAYAVMKDGATSKVVIYSRKEIDAVRAVSKTSARPDSPWNQWYDRMALKTVIHRLEHFVPTSAEYRREQLRAAAEISRQVNAATTVTATPAARPGDPQYVDAEIVGDTQNVPPAETAAAVPPYSPQQQQDGTAGGTSTPPALITTGQSRQLDDQRQRLLYGDSEQDWDDWLAGLAKLAGLAALATPGELTQAEAKHVIERLKTLPDAKALRRLLDTGETP
jgi:recombination protein RecT